MGETQVTDDQVVDRVRASFDRQGLMRLLGARLGRGGARPGADRPAATSRGVQQHGYVHAGATSAIADTAGGYAALTLMPAISEVLTVEYKLNLLAPAAGDLEATGTVLRPGRTLTICRLEVFHRRRPAQARRRRTADPHQRPHRPRLMTTASPQLPTWVTWQQRPFPDANLLLLTGPSRPSSTVASSGTPTTPPTGYAPVYRTSRSW